MRIMVAVGCGLVAAFCAFGFLASFEPSALAIPFRIGYAVVGVLAAIGAVQALLGRAGQ